MKPLGIEQKKVADAAPPGFRRFRVPAHPKLN